jgi:hypothetical protein
MQRSEKLPAVKMLQSKPIHIATLGRVLPLMENLYLRGLDGNAKICCRDAERISQRSSRLDSGISPNGSGCGAKSEFYLGLALDYAERQCRIAHVWGRDRANSACGELTKMYLPAVELAILGGIVFAVGVLFAWRERKATLSSRREGDHPHKA